MSAAERARRLLRLSPGEVARRAAGFAGRAAARWLAERRDRGGTWGPPVDAPLARGYFAARDVDMLRADVERVRALAALYLDHRFDLLGSGWVRVEHGMRCAGVEGHVHPSSPTVDADADGAWLAGRIDPGNLADARRVWRLVDAGYRPIDWQLDFKSGQRWDEGTWHGRIRYGGLPGVDVKVPWELARMQHLPQLAWAYALARAGEPGFAPAEAYAREMRGQVLDFIATNPPRYGVNWAMPMDVGIRVANWLAARDLFLALGAEFDAAFEAELARSVHAHAAHLAGHLEWNGGQRGNHYLADIAGLLFAAAYLPRSAQVDAWLAFAVQALVDETEYQFTPDGACFEASVPYHRLSAEMVAYGTALVLGLPPERTAALRTYDAALHRGPPPLRPGPIRMHPLPSGQGESPFPPAHIERVRRMAEFTRDVTQPDGAVHQVGDNDSGRLFKLWPAVRRTTVAEALARYANLGGWTGAADGAEYWDEDPLDHQHLVAAADGLFARMDFEAFAPGHPEREIVRGLARGAAFAAAAEDGSAAEVASIGSEAGWTRAVQAAAAEGMRVRRWSHPLPAEAAEERNYYAYPHFGLYIVRAPGVYLALRCGGSGQAPLGAHAHNDQLALELAVGDAHPVRDPGTYLYTPLRARRDAYRAAAAHFAPRGGTAEPAPLDGGLFYLDQRNVGECLYFGPRGFAGVTRAWGEPVYRIVELREDRVVVTDAGRTLLDAAYAPPPFSPGYGVRHG